MENVIQPLLAVLPYDLNEEGLLGALVGVGIIAAIAFIAHWLARLLILNVLEAILSRQHTRRDDLLVERHVFRRLVHIIPALVIYSLATPLLPQYGGLAQFIVVASQLYMIVMIALFVDALLNVLLEVYRGFEISRHFPIKSFVQVFKLLLYFLATIALISVVLGESPLQLLAGLGAMTAILMLIFKDPILGFVAGLQLSSNRMVSIGDWIEMPQHGVDGDVLEIALTTVKVRNFDNTITTVPTQALINDAFKNWAGMQRSGGRRIKRAVSIDVSSIRFCDEEMLERFSRIQYISEYIQQKKQELARENNARQVDLSQLANGRRLTNIGTFRAYVEAYLHDHPQINQQLTFLVRQLAPTETGVPIEVYVFSKEKRWALYEGIQSDIFDHILAVIPAFDLRLFQYPSNLDPRIALPETTKGLL